MVVLKKKIMSPMRLYVKSGFFFFFSVFRATPWHIEVPRLGIKSEL